MININGLTDTDVNLYGSVNNEANMDCSKIKLKMTEYDTVEYDSLFHDIYYLKNLREADDDSMERVKELEESYDYEHKYTAIEKGPSGKSLGLGINGNKNTIPTIENSVSGNSVSGNSVSDNSVQYNVSDNSVHKNISDNSVNHNISDSSINHNISNNSVSHDSDEVGQEERAIALKEFVNKNTDDDKKVFEGFASGGKNTGTVIGAIVGVIVLAILLVVGYYLYNMRKAKKLAKLAKSAL